MKFDPLQTLRSFSDGDLAKDRAELLELLRERAFEKKKVVLASGKKSSFYIDSKQVTLLARGHVLIGKLLLREVWRYEERTGRKVAAVGGLTLGADPIASAVSMASALTARPVSAFIVRKAAKGHGTEAAIEGARNIPKGAEVVVLEDVITTGGSAKDAVDRVRANGLEVSLVLGLVDRKEGGRELLRSKGKVEVVSLFDRSDFLPDS